MPYTVNGIGTHVCGGRGDVGYGGYDAMEWIVVFFMPVIPIKAMHVFDWQGDNFRMVPIKWSFDLVFRTFFTTWNWGLLIVGVVVNIIAVVTLFDSRPKEATSLILFAVGGVALLLCLAVFLLLRCTGERTRDIRRIIGPHGAGSADPATLTDSAIAPLAEEPPPLGKSSHAEAALELLAMGHYAQAMWAARVSVALEGRAGEEATSAILADLGVQEALEQVRRDPSAWQSAMLSPEERRGMLMNNIRL